MSLEERMSKIQALVLDVDGVLTDGTFYWGMNGDEFKKLSFADVMGVSLAVKAGVRVALISGEDNAIVDRFAEKMHITDVYKGTRDKGGCLKDLMDKYGLSANQVCYIGDDVNDIPALEQVGVPVAVRDANSKVVPHVAYQTSRGGGDGAVREVVDMILDAKSEA